MIPEKLYREQDSSVSEAFEDAHQQSVQNAAINVWNSIREGDNEYVAEGEYLLSNSDEILKNLEKLKKAIKGSLVTEYTLNK